MGAVAATDHARGHCAAAPGIGYQEVVAHCEVLVGRCGGGLLNFVRLEEMDFWFC